MSRILRMTVPEKPYSANHSMFVSNSYVGLEIEMEAVSQSVTQGLRNWRQVSEQSVDGWEIVLREPKCENQLYLAIEELRTISGNIDEVRTFTERTSNHVHIDVRDMTYIQLMNFLTLAVMFEPVLYKYVAPHRSSNHFCWSFLDCQNLITRITKVNKVYLEGNPDAVREEMTRQFSTNATKYSGINLSSIPNYGSLEFRMHEGTINTNAITRWINILLSIKSYAMDEGRTPSNILETKQDVGIDSIFTAVLSQYRGILTYDGVAEDILKGIRSAQDFVYTITTPAVVSTLPSNPRGVYQRFLQSVNPNDLTSTGTRELANA
jgi:hypothetical protein